MEDNIIYTDGKFIKDMIRDKIMYKPSIVEIDFKACRIDNDYINKYRLIYGKEFENLSVHDGKLVITLDSSDGKVHLRGDITGLFDDFYNVEIMDLGSLDTSEIDNMDKLFKNCDSLKELNLLNFNTSNVTSMVGMFYNCRNLSKLDLSNFNTDKLEKVQSMFSGCNSLVDLNITNFNTENVVNMMWMFNNCTSFKELDLSNFNTKNVRSMYGMFNYCTNLEFINLINFNTNKSKDNLENIFKGSNIREIITKDKRLLDELNRHRECI